jgi:transcription elongation factor Elf1
MRLRILGETKLKRDYLCPYCGKVAKHQGSLVEIIQDMDTGKQTAAFFCSFCKQEISAGQ